MRRPPDPRTRDRKTPREPAARSARGAPGREGPGFLPLLLASLLAAFVLFGASLPHGWLSDDASLVQGNQTLERRAPGTILGIWTSDYWEQLGPNGERFRAGADRNLYRPVTILSFWINARLGATTPSDFRLTNLLLHALAAALIGLLAKKRIGFIAGWGAMLFTVAHPVALDVINRLVGRADLLVLVGMALALVTQTATRGGWRPRHVALLALATLIATGAKESGFAVVPLVLLVAWLDRGKAPRPWPGPAIVGGVALIMIGLRLAVVGFPRYHPDARIDLVMNPLSGLGLVDRLPGALANVTWYVRMLILPWPMKAIDRPLVLPGWGSLETWLGAALLAGIMAMLVLLLRRRHEAALAPGWWLAGFLVVGQLLLPIGAFRETRLLYPLLGSTAWLVAATLQGSAATAVDRRRAPGPVIVTGLLVATWVLTIFLRTPVYTDDRHLLEADLSQDPAPLTYLMLGTLYQAEGRMAEARAAKERALRLAPNSSQALADVGALDIDTNNFGRADSLLARAVALAPNNSVAWLDYGTLRLRQDRLTESHDLFLRAERLDPEFILTQLNLTLVEIRLGQRDAARTRLGRLERRAPNDPRVRDLRGMLAASGG